MVPYPVGALVSWCEACVHPIDGTLDTTSFSTQSEFNRSAMGPFDWVCLAFAACIAAFTLVGEYRDIRLCSVAIVRAGRLLSPRMRIALIMLGGLRRWCFLPGLIVPLIMIPLAKGGDALNVCFNTVALLFLGEIDNVAYSVGLSERVRARVDVSGRIRLTDDEAQALDKAKTAHIVLIVLTILIGVSLPTWEGVFLGFPAFCIGGSVEAWTSPPADGEEINAGGKALCIAKVWLRGMVGLGLFGGFTFGAFWIGGL